MKTSPVEAEFVPRGRTYGHTWRS